MLAPSDRGLHPRRSSGRRASRRGGASAGRLFLTLYHILGYMQLAFLLCYLERADVPLCYVTPPKAAT